MDNPANHLEILYGDHDRGEVSNEETAMHVALMSIENVDLPAHSLARLLASDDCKLGLAAGRVAVRRVVQLQAVN
jgi:hypothetical protein